MSQYVQSYINGDPGVIFYPEEDTEGLAAIANGTATGPVINVPRGTRRVILDFTLTGTDVDGVVGADPYPDRIAWTVLPLIGDSDWESTVQIVQEAGILHYGLEQPIYEVAGYPLPIQNAPWPGNTSKQLTLEIRNPYQLGSITSYLGVSYCVKNGGGGGYTHQKVAHPYTINIVDGPEDDPIDPPSPLVDTPTLPPIAPLPPLPPSVGTLPSITIAEPFNDPSIVAGAVLTLPGSVIETPTTTADPIGCGGCPDPLIEVMIDSENLPIQAGAQGPRTTSYLRAKDLTPGEYEVLYTATRCDGSECLTSITIEVLDPVVGEYDLPIITVDSLPHGIVGRSYLDNRAATLVINTTDPDSSLTLTARQKGSLGNNITLELKVLKSGTTPVKNSILQATIVGNVITVTLGTDSTGNVTTQAKDLRTLLRSNSAINDVIIVGLSGSGTGIVPETPVAPLTGGVTSAAVLKATKGQIGTAQGVCATGTETDSSDEVPTNEAPEFTWFISTREVGRSGLPEGLTLDVATGQIQGIPTEEGDFLVTVHVTDEQGNRATKQLPLTIFPSRPEPTTRPGETRRLPEQYPEETVALDEIPTEPIPEVLLQTLNPAKDLKVAFWSPVPLFSKLNNTATPGDTQINSRLTWEGDKSQCVIGMDLPEGEGPWTEIRLSIRARKTPNNPSNLRTSLEIRPLSVLRPLGITKEQSTVPLTEEFVIHELVWRGLWFYEEMKALSFQITPKVRNETSDEITQECYVEVNRLTCVVRAVPMPPIQLEFTPLVLGQPIGNFQVSPNLTDEFKVYEMLWTGHYTQREIEDLSVFVDVRVGQRDDANAATPLAMIQALEVVVSPEPPPELPLPPIDLPDLFTVAMVPDSAASLDSHTFLVRVTSNGFDGTALMHLSWIGTNPGVVGTFSDDRLEIANGETVQTELTITNLTAAQGTVARFAVQALASNGDGSGTSGQVLYYVDNPAPDPLPPLDIPEGSTEFLLTPIPSVVRIPTSGTTTTAVQVTSSLGTTLVALSASIRPANAGLQVYFENSTVIPAPGIPRISTLRIDAYDVAERTYSVDILGVGADGGQVRTQVALVVSGPPVFPIPSLPPLPPAVTPSVPVVVETLVPEATLRQIGTISGTWADINNTVMSPSPEVLLLSFGPPPLTGLGAVDLSMTDPVADAIWKTLTIRVKVAKVRDVQSPALTFQPYIAGQAVGSLHQVDTAHGLSIHSNIFAMSWEGSWTTNDLRTLVVQVCGFTTANQVELNGFEITEVDAVVSGDLRKPLPPRSPFRLIPDGEHETTGIEWTYQPLGDYRDISDDVDCPYDDNYATLTLAAGESTVKILRLSDPPVTARWEKLLLRLRSKLVTTGVDEDNQPTVKVSLIFPTDQEEAGIEESYSTNTWSDLKHRYSGTWDDSDITGLLVKVEITNPEEADSVEIRISALDVLAEGIPLATEDRKLIPVGETQVFGSVQGSYLNIDEGLAWPDSIDEDLNLPILTSPDPLPDGPQQSIVSPDDYDYQVIPLGEDSRTAQIYYSISDVPYGELIEDTTLSPPPPYEGSPPSPDSPPTNGGYETDHYTAIKVRFRLHQDPRLVTPDETVVPPETALSLGDGFSSVLPTGIVGTNFLYNGAPFFLEVSGGRAPYEWRTFIVETQGSNLSGHPPGLVFAQDEDDSSHFDITGRPTLAGTYQFGVSVRDAKDRVLSFTVFQTINSVVPSPPPPPPPPPGSPPPPPPPDMDIWFQGYSVGESPINGLLYVAPDTPDSEVPEGALKADYLEIVEIGDILEIEGKLYEKAILNRDDLIWTTSNTNTDDTVAGPQSDVYGIDVNTAPPAFINAGQTKTITVKFTYLGVDGLAETGKTNVTVTGKPNAEGDANLRGTGTGSFNWKYGANIQIVTETLPNAMVGVSYSETLQAIGGTPGYTWGELLSVSSGLPPNILLNNNTGEISGVPIQTGNFLFQVGVVDTRGKTAVKTYSLRVTAFAVSPPPPPPGSPPPPPPGSPPPPPPPSESPPAPPVDSYEEVPSIQVRVQPLVASSCDNNLYGLGPKTINGFLIPRPPIGSANTIPEGPWGNFEHTWYGSWTDEQLRGMLVLLDAELEDPVSPGSRNNLYISALDVIVTKAYAPGQGLWPASTPPEGRLKWLGSRSLNETGPNSGKWKDGDTLPYRGEAPDKFPYLTSILGTAHKGGLNQAQADTALNRFEIYGWLDRDGDTTASPADIDRHSIGWLGSNIGPTDIELLVTHLVGLMDEKAKTFQGFMIDDELIVVRKDNIKLNEGKLVYVQRGVNETQPASHVKGTPILPVPYWEKMYLIRVTVPEGDESFKGNAVGFDTPPGTDEGTPGELLQNGPLDLRSYSGEWPINWLLRLRVVDVYGLTTETDITTPGFPDRFTSVGPLAHFGLDGSAEAKVPAKRVLNVKQSRPPKPPKIRESQ